MLPELLGSSKWLWRPREVRLRWTGNKSELRDFSREDRAALCRHKEKPGWEPSTDKSRRTKLNYPGSAGGMKNRNHSQNSGNWAPSTFQILPISWGRKWISWRATIERSSQQSRSSTWLNKFSSPFLSTDSPTILLLSTEHQNPNEKRYWIEIIGIIRIWRI